MFGFPVNTFAKICLYFSKVILKPRKRVCEEIYTFSLKKLNCNLINNALNTKD